MMPASAPGLMSSTSTTKPRRSAQRVYIRSSNSAQSCASTPPSLALICTMTSTASCSPVKRLRISKTPSPEATFEIPAWISGSWDSSSTSRAISCRTSRSSTMARRPSYSSTSDFTFAYSLLIFLASSWSSHKSGREISISNSLRRAREAPILRYSSASPSRRASSRRSLVKSRI